MSNADVLSALNKIAGVVPDRPEDRVGFLANSRQATYEQAAEDSPSVVAAYEARIESMIVKDRRIYA